MYELKNNINNYLHLDIRDGQANELGDYYIRGCIYGNKINDIIENTPFISDVRKLLARGFIIRYCGCIKKSEA